MKNLIFFLLLIAFCSACKEKTNDPFYIPQSYKDVGYFKKDSYWIYKNEKTSLSDCTLINKDPEHYNQPYESTTKEVIDIRYSSAYFRETFISNDAVSLACKTFAACTFSDQNVVDTLPEIIINGSVYHNVYLNHFTTTGLHGPQIIDSWVVPHIGIIKLSKQENGTDTTLTLLRYKVAQ